MLTLGLSLPRASSLYPLFSPLFLTPYLQSRSPIKLSGLLLFPLNFFGKPLGIVLPTWIYPIFQPQLTLLLNVVLYVSQLRNPQIISLSIATLPRAFGAIISNWSTSPVFSRGKRLTLSTFRGRYLCASLRVSFGFFCLHSLLWAIWKERTRRVFENTVGDLSSVWESFYFL